ncbi:hypothetical protein [Caballeronia humi]|uniref:Uncharacterized protein n=1 Tax=Caballeronia humi TaxID=326474 RepID=A0A158J0Y6_9BURK|nr:hypothetical protein [Caballeronia humi]SAL62527.1 hypothetical protein AWB65_05756 [Caballeronia humi]
MRAKIKPLQEAVSGNDLFQKLGKQRDFIVHHGALNLNSRGKIGTTEGAKIKFTFPFAVHPWESSDEAYERYKAICQTRKMTRGLGPDCDSAPALWRTWLAGCSVSQVKRVWAMRESTAIKTSFSERSRHQMIERAAHQAFVYGFIADRLAVECFRHIDGNRGFEGIRLGIPNVRDESDPLSK